MACDLCGKRGVQLGVLREQYKSDNIQDICHSCQDDVNNHLAKIQNLNRSFAQKALKKFMREKRFNCCKE